jgi:hypothetical protein
MDAAVMLSEAKHLGLDCCVNSRFFALLRMKREGNVD